jgi:hypothetical protein
MHTFMPTLMRHGPPSHTQTLMSDWPPLTTYICKMCGDYPRVETDGERRWGCYVCDDITHIPDLKFRERHIG